MTTFPFPWDAAFEAEPADNELRSLGASRIRDLKNAIAARMAVDHSFAGDANDGKHIQVELMIAASDPSLDPTDGCVYTKVITGNTELFYKDSSGNVLQLTNAGAIDQQSFPSGTLLAFPQAAAPTGWTQVNTWNDVVVRVVDSTGTGGATGGSWTIAGTTVTIATHVLSATEIPSHTHNVTVGNQLNAAQFGTAAAGAPSGGTKGFTTDGGTGGGGAHGHPGSTFSNDATWRPAYVNSIIASKN